MTTNLNQFILFKTGEFFPVLLNDYHEIRYISDILKCINKKFKIFEYKYDNDNYQYTGIIYVGKKPTNKQIKERLDAICL